MEVKKKEVKDYLSKSKLGEYTINPYVGCPHKCKYCYASFMKRFTNHPEEWGEFIDIKLSSKKIDLKKIDGKNVFMSSVTDCYNPFEAQYRITRNILEQLVNANCTLQISTKNKLILRDIDLLKKIKNLSIAMSVNTLDENFRKDMDRASTIKERLETLKIMHESGIYTILFMSPIFIGITDWKAIIEETKEYINEYWFEDLNLRGAYKYDILKYIQEKYSHVYPLFERIYVRGDKQELINMDNEIKDYCNKNRIKYSDYFHHEEVIKNKENNKLGKK